MSDAIEIDEVVVDELSGETRKTGCLPLAEPGRTRLAWPVFGDSAGSPDLIPRDRWFENDLSQWCSPVKDQDGKNACNAFATVNALEACRRLAGMRDVRLSPGDLYHRINGGRDQGSYLEDALEKMMAEGVATAETVPELVVHGSEVRADRAAVAAERAKYRFLEAWQCPTWEHAVSALLRGYFLDTGVFWYGSDPVDSQGWIGVRGSGGRGGHAICGCGVAGRMSGGRTRFGIKFVNSWSPRWGVDGFGVMPEERATEGIGVFGWWALRAVVVPSDEDDTPPAPAG